MTDEELLAEVERSAALLADAEAMAREQSSPVALALVAFGRLALCLIRSELPTA